MIAWEWGGVEQFQPGDAKYVRTVDDLEAAYVGSGAISSRFGK